MSNSHVVALFRIKPIKGVLMLDRIGKGVFLDVLPNNRVTEIKEASAGIPKTMTGHRNDLKRRKNWIPTIP